MGAGRGDSRDELLRAVRGADGILSLLTERIDAELLDAAEPAQGGGQPGGGLRQLRLAEMSGRGVIGTNTPDVLTDTTADLAFALLMATARMLPQAQQYVLDGQWHTWEPLGFLGPGRAPRHPGPGGPGADRGRWPAGGRLRDEGDLLRRLPAPGPGAAVRLRVPRFDGGGAARADFVSLHTPLTDETHHLMNAERLGMMKPTAVLINSSRGPVVDPSALYDALKNGTIWGAGLDVTEPEPLPVDDPLLTLENCLVVPHIASASINTRDQMSELAPTTSSTSSREGAPHPRQPGGRRAPGAE